MKIVKLGRGAGKTTEMLVWLLEGHAKGVDRALIVTTQQRRVELSKRLHTLYNENNRPQYINNAANRIYTVEAVKKMSMRSKGFDKCEIGIDDADHVLIWLLGINRLPSIISVTEQDPTIDQPGTIVTFDKKVEEMAENEISFR